MSREQRISSAVLLLFGIFVWLAFYEKHPANYEISFRERALAAYPTHSAQMALLRDFQFRCEGLGKFVQASSSMVLQFHVTDDPEGEAFYCFRKDLPPELQVVRTAVS